MSHDPLAARSVALDLLAAVLGRHRPLDQAVDDHRALGRLDERDRGFARLLATKTLRRLGQVDALLAARLERSLPRAARGARDILRLGVTQLVFLDTPPHAAVDTAVALAQARRQGAYKKLVNAILRRVADEGPGLAAAQDAARLNTPDWLWESWCRAYGEDIGRRIAEAHLEEPPLDLSVAEDPAAWAARLDATVLPTGSLRCRPRGPVANLPGFADGAWWVQDAAAALPARLLGDVSGRAVVDLCAAPGGKTAQLAAAGAQVIAVERSRPRLTRLAENLARLGLRAETVTADGTTWRPSRPVDAVLVDAPCSATGTIRRHPDVARLKRPDDIPPLVDAQRRLLAAAVDMVRPGGTVVYAACSLQAQEGPGVVDSVLAAGTPAVREAIGAGEVGGLAELVTADGALRSLPCHLAGAGGMDGFYAARLRRTAD